MDIQSFSFQNFALSKKTWIERHGSNEDLLCFTVAFYLLNDFISLNDIQLSNELYNNPYIEWDNETQNRYYTLFRPVKINYDFNIEQSANAINEIWNKINVNLRITWLH